MSLLLPWVMVSVNACGQHTSTLTGIQLAIGTHKLYQQAVQLGTDLTQLGSGTPDLARVQHALLAVTIAVGAVTAAGVAGLVGARWSFVPGVAGLAFFAWVESRVQAVVSSATTGVVSVSLRYGFFVALIGAALLGVALARDPHERPEAHHERGQYEPDVEVAAE